MRLLDAVRGGGLVVPRDILKVEEDLRKEWKRKDKEARSAAGNGAAGVNTGAGAKTTNRNKRKGAGEEEGAPTPQAAATAKKTKTANSTPAKNTEAGNGAKKTATKTSAEKSEPAPMPTADPARPRTKQTAKCSRGAATVGSRGASTVGSRNNRTPAVTEPEPMRPPRTKQTAKCSRVRGGATASSRGMSQTPAASTESPKPARAPRTKQTARRSNPFFGDRRPMDPLYKQEYSTPVYHSSPENVGSSCIICLAVFFLIYIRQDYGPNPMEIDPTGDYKSRDESDDPDNGSKTPLPPLGLVNGEYEIYSSDLNQWPQFPEDEFTLILGLAGNSMWGSYDFGMFHGIMHFEERPWSSSYKKIQFTWRGRNNSEGEMSFGPNCTGWIQFYGEGRICGQLNCYGNARFSGQRISGEETQPPRSVQSMREEWNGYNQVEYDNESRRRWGGW